MEFLSLDDDLLNVSLSSFGEADLSEASKSVSMQDDIVLTKKVVDKICSNGDVFNGLVDAVTGDMIHGRLISNRQREIYEGPFCKGKRHGVGGVSEKLDSTCKAHGR